MLKSEVPNMKFERSFNNCMLICAQEVWSMHAVSFAENYISYERRLYSEAI